MTQTTTFEKCIEFEEKTHSITTHAISLFGFTRFTHIPYDTPVTQSLQRKGVDFIGSMLGYDDIWIDAKVRSYTGYDYTDIAIEEKSLDIRKKKSDMLLYITPNRDHIACYAIDLNIVREHTNTIPVKGIRPGKKGVNETIMIFDIPVLQRYKALTKLTLSYKLYAKNHFTI